MSKAISFENYNQLTHMTDEIQFIPNDWSRLDEYFTHIGIPSTSVTLDLVKGQLNVLNDMVRGAQVQYGQDDVEKTLSYPTAFFPANDLVSPTDVQNKRKMGTSDQVDQVDAAVARKLGTLRKSHALTQEFMMWKAVQGVLMTPTGKTLGNLYTDFGVTLKEINFELSVETTNVQEKCRELLRHVEDNAYTGADVGGVRVFVSPEFFDALIGHESVSDAYSFFTAGQGNEPLRDDMRRAFSFAGVTFEEFRGKYQKVDGTIERFIAASEGWAIPTGIEDMFEIYHAPAHHIDYANTAGEEVYAWSVPMRDMSGIEIFTQSSSIAINRRPQAVVKCIAG
jgi:hypothetical protein